jgi:hypothetical protein
VRQPCLVAAALLTLACGRSSADPGTGFTSVATTRDLMDGIVVPYSQTIFQSIAYENGQLTRAPRNDDDWHQLSVRAASLGEVGNLLMVGPRRKDDGDWVAIAHRFTLAAGAVAKAANDKDIDRTLLAGGDLYDTCTECHRKYLPQ